jgi:hypothetical protein
MSDNDAKLQQLRDIVGQVIPEEQADSFVQYVRLDAFTDEDGEIDQDKVMGHLTAIVVARTPPQPPNWGQTSGNPPPQQPGAAARAQLKKRYGVENDVTPGYMTGIRPGGSARAALAKRYGRTKK